MSHFASVQRAKAEAGRMPALPDPQAMAPAPPARDPNPETRNPLPEIHYNLRAAQEEQALRLPPRLATPAPNPNQDAFETGLAFTNRRENPDPTVKVLQPHNRGSYNYPFGLYDEIRDKDLQVLSALGQRVNGVLGAPFSLPPIGRTLDGAVVAAFCEAAWAVVRQRRSALEGLHGGGLFNGLGAMNQIWRYEPAFSFERPSTEPKPGAPPKLTTENRRAIVCGYLEDRHPRNFIFTPENEPRLLTQQDMLYGESLPPFAFTFFTPDHRYGNPYGVGLGRPVAWWSKFKRDGIAALLIAIEKFGTPFVVLTHQAGASPEEKSSYQKIVTSIKAQTGMIIETGMLVEVFDQMNKSGTVDLHEFLERYCDEQITKGILGQLLTTQMGEGGKGGYSASQTHYDVRLDFLKRDAELLSEALYEGFFKPLVMFNFDHKLWPLTPRPQFDLDPPADAKANAERFDILGNKLRLPLKTSQVYSECNAEVPADPADTLEPAPPPIDPLSPEGQAATKKMLDGKPAADDKPGAGKPEDKDDKLKPGDKDPGKPGKTAQASLFAAADGPTARLIAVGEQLPAGNLRKLYSAGVAAMSKITKAIPAQVGEQLAAVLRATYGDDWSQPLTAQIGGWHLGLTFSDELKFGFIDRLNDDLTLAALYGRETLRKQRPTASAAAAQVVTFPKTQMYFAGANPATPSLQAAAGDSLKNPLIEALFGTERIVPKRVLSVFTRKTFAGMSYEQFYQLDALGRSSAFTAWDLAEAEVRHIGGALQDAIHHGYTVQQFHDYTVDRLQARYISSGDDLHAWHVETIYHQNLATAYNQAQADELDASAELFPYYQVINPDPQHPRCVEASGNVYPIAMLRATGVPPWHWGCGSSIASMTAETAARLGVVVETFPPINQPEHYAGPINPVTGQRVGSSQPFGAWAPLSERYENLAQQRELLNLGGNDA